MDFIKKYNILIVLLIVFLVYLPSLNNGFTNWDDNSHILFNDNVRHFNAGRISDIFSETVLKSYIPLTTLSFGIERYFFGFNHVVFHLDNLILHLLVVWLGYLCAQSLGFKKSEALIASLIFGIHPMHVESVAWATERKDVLYSFFYMLAIYNYIDYAKNKNTTTYKYSLICCLLSMLAKPMAISLPLILFLIDFWLQRKINRQILIEKISFFLVVVPLGMITYSLHVRNPITDISESFLIWFWTLSFYLQKFMWPFGLRPLYELPLPIAFNNIEYINSILFIFFITIVIYRLRRSRVFVYAGAHYFFSIFFLLKFDDTEAIIVADRYMYLSSLGVCLLLSHIVVRCYSLLNNKKLRYLFYLFTFIVISGLAFLTYRQIKVWKGSVSLWTHNLKYAPNSWQSYSNRGNELLKDGFNELALEDYSKAIKLNPDSAEIYASRGNSYVGMKKYDLGLADYNKAITLEPINPAFYVNRGIARINLRMYDYALKDFEKAILMDNNAVIAYVNRSSIYINQGKYKEALKDLNKAIAIEDDIPVTYYNRSIIFAVNRNIDAAIKDALKAKELGYPGIDKYIATLNEYNN